MFVDREAELRELRALADRHEPSLALVYGRRRVGKTHLLDHAWEGRRQFYYLAAEATAAVNRRDLLAGVASTFDLDVDSADYPTWHAVFGLLVRLAADAPLVVVLDEFQHLLGEEDDDIVSQLVAVWDREVGDRPLSLVLCGSEVGAMARLQAGGSPLYGRLGWAARIRPFDYRDAAALVEDRSRRERAYIYGVAGGAPRFLETVPPGAGLDGWITRFVLSPRGEVHLQLATIVQQEKGIRDPADYQAVLRAVADERTETNEIATATGLEDRPHVVRRALETLEELQLVRRERNFGAGRRAAWRNRIADNAVQFWYRFVHPNRSRLALGGAPAVWEHRVKPFLDDYMDWTVFERMAEESFRRLHERWGFPGAAEWTRWEGRDRNRREIEVDIVARLDDGRMLTGEVKWSARPLGPKMHYDLLRDLEDLSNSGRTWASAALDPARSAGHLYFSAGGFTEPFRRQAEESGDVRLIGLEEMYHE